MTINGVVKRLVWFAGEQDLMVLLPKVILKVYSGLSLRSLGYNIGIPRVASKFGKLPNETQFGFNNLACTGTEESLFQCLHSQV